MLKYYALKINFHFNLAVLSHDHVMISSLECKGVR
jgi:hypothetical protein